MVGLIAIILVGIGGAIGSIIRLYYTYPSDIGGSILMTTVLLVFVGGALGSIVRFLISGYMFPLSGSSGFPFGTLIANILASLLFAGIYVLLAKYIKEDIKTELLVLCTIGIAGGLSTFSTFALDVMIMIDRKETSKMITYILVSLIACIGSIFIIFYYFPFQNQIKFPMSTLKINLFGSFMMGIIIAFMARFGKGGYSATVVHVFIVSGILGGMTTFSAFAIDFVILCNQGDIDDAIIYGLASVVGAILSFVIGMKMIKFVLKR